MFPNHYKQQNIFDYVCSYNRWITDGRGLAVRILKIQIIKCKYYANIVLLSL